MLHIHFHFGIPFFKSLWFKIYSALSEVPNSKAVAGVRIGLVNDKFIVNPTTKEMEDSELDLVLAGTDSAILMIEASPFFSAFLKGDFYVPTLCAP